MCHGTDGKGDTKIGGILGCKDFTDAKVQADIKDDAAFKAIKEGLKSDDGRKLMKPPIYTQDLWNVHLVRSSEERVPFLRFHGWPQAIHLFAPVPGGNEATRTGLSSLGDDVDDAVPYTCAWQPMVKTAP